MSDVLEEANRLIQQGWGSIDPKTTAIQQHKQASEQFEFALSVAAAFSTPKGKVALVQLRERFERPPTWTPHVTNISDTTAYGFIREGQKSVITFIENAIKLAEKGPPEKPAAQE